MAEEHKARRLFLVDPACVQTTGHNLAALCHFAELLRPLGQVQMFGCRYLEHAISVRTGVRRFFEWYYPDIFTKALFPPIADHCGRRIQADQLIEAAAHRDAERLLTLHDITSSDLIVFPSADIYGVLGILRAVALRPPESRPLVCLRFINVMEHGAPRMVQPREVLLDRLGVALAHGLRISVSAETAKYAGYLASRLGVHVTVTPFPATGEWEPLPSRDAFVVGHIGTARRDKGFFEILRIAKAVRKREGSEGIRFVIQTPGEVETFKNIEYISQMYALPGIAFVSDRPCRSEWLAILKQCHCILLPYDVQMYAFRGSAIAMDAAQVGRPVITLSGVGFAPEILFYNLGAVVSTVDEIAPAIFQMASESPVSLQRQILQGRMRLINDAQRAYTEWLGKHSISLRGIHV